MAATKTILSRSHNKAMVRVVATANADASVVDISADLLAPNETQTGTAKVHIGRVLYSTDTNVKITRNGVTIAHLYNNGWLEETWWNINDEEDQDITVTFGGAGMVVLELKKVSGFNNPVESEIYGSYDDPTQVGA